MHVQTYAPMFMLFVVATVIASAFFTLATLLGPKAPNAVKSMPFECGSDSDGAKNVKISIKYYLTAILFVVFDIESVFVYPWAAQFRSLGWMGLASMMGFLVVIFLGLVYVWKKGALEWEN
jgi:NADH-quinone oxidoreductase subunit A